MSHRIAEVAVSLWAESGQFYVEDDGAGGDTEAVWTGSSLESHIGAVPGLVAVGTVMPKTVRVEIEVWDGEPELDIDRHDHVSEASLEVGSGTIVLEECLGNPRMAELTVAPGWYRLRVLADNLDSAESEDNHDVYRCQIWQAPPAPEKVLRWWEPWAPGPPAVNPFGLRVMSGAEAWDARRKMTSVGRRIMADGNTAFLHRDANGAYWEYGRHGKHLVDLIEVPQSEVEHYSPEP